ncbi:MAG: hypothetical protein HYU36_23305 [Planctomycetes bacterium]|nr:hypothetical protein [Planctomycetota bacterium]
MNRTFAPVRRSALHHPHRLLGAVMETYQGWEMPREFRPAAEEAAHVRSAAGLCDVSWLVKLDVKGRGWTPASSAGHTLDGTVSRWRLAAGHWLVLARPEGGAGALEGLQAAERQLPCLHVTDVTSVYCALLLAGPRSRDVLEKLTSADVSDSGLPNQGAAQAGLAHVHAAILREDRGPLPAYLLLVRRDVAESVWDAVNEAGGEYGLIPFGFSAAEHLGAGV